MNACRRKSNLALFSIVFACAAALMLSLPMHAIGDDEEVYFSVQRLTSDGFTPGKNTDVNLQNPWGLAFGPDSFMYVANNESGFITVYDGLGEVQSKVIDVPGAAGKNEHGHPTGIVANPSQDFQVTVGNKTGRARLIIAGQDGVISAYVPEIDDSDAVVVIDNSGSNAVYTGITIAANGNERLLFVTDFFHRKIEVYDASFQPVALNLTDRTIESGFAPFNIQNIEGDLFVTYAQQDAAREDCQDTDGFVRVFNVRGGLVHRAISHGELNAPWGITLAPSDFGDRANARLLIANHGDGTVLIYDFATFEFLGKMRLCNSELTLDGLWGLRFGNGLESQPTNRLFFTAGVADEAHGLYGRITPSECTIK